MLLDIYDPKAPPRAIGIDLGTTNSIVAYVRDGQPTALLNCDGTQLLPSVVHYGDHGQVQAGRTALSYLTREPERTIVHASIAGERDVVGALDEKGAVLARIVAEDAGHDERLRAPLKRDLYARARRP